MLQLCENSLVLAVIIMDVVQRRQASKVAVDEKRPGQPCHRDGMLPLLELSRMSTICGFSRKTMVAVLANWVDERTASTSSAREETTTSPAVMPLMD